MPPAIQKKRTKTTSKRKSPPKPPPLSSQVPLGNNPFGGSFNHSLPGETKEEDLPPDMLEEEKVHEDALVDVLGNLAVTLDIKFHDKAARKPIGNLLNERVEGGATIKSIGWYPAHVHEPEKDSMRDYTEADGQRIVVKKTKYLTVIPDRPPGTMGRIYRRDDGVWRVCDVMCAILDTERRARPMTEWFGGIDSHHVMLDGVECTDGLVQYWFGS